MSDGDTPTSGIDGTRRRLLALAAATGTLGGCSVAGFGPGGGSEDCGTPAADADLSGPVPAAYRGVESTGELERKPSKLLAKAEADYQRRPNGDQECSKCSYYVPDRNDDCLGACVRVEGLIAPSGYCEYYRTQTGGGW